MLSPGRKRPDAEEPPREDEDPSGLAALVRRILPRSPGPEERLERLVAERRRELDEHAARFAETLDDLERREGLLRDSRASVERLLRLGARELDAREQDLARLVRELTEREARIEEEASDLTLRRSELGAVELKRAAVEGRERALAAREALLEAREARLEEREAATRVDTGARPETAARVVLFVPGASYRLIEIEHRPVEPGAVIRLDGDDYAVTRTGRSPLPGDPRTCAYLVREAPGPLPSTGSS